MSVSSMRSLIQRIMAGFLQVFYNCLVYLYDCFCSTWLVSIIYGTRLRKPSSDTISILLRLIHYLHQDDQSEYSSTIFHLIKSLPANEDILSFTDSADELNVLQHAIVLNNKEVVSLLLEKINLPLYGQCNSPVHLAALLGHTHILQRLIEKRHGTVLSLGGLCYPNRHLPVSVMKRFGLVQQAVYQCKAEQYLPVEFAIKGDHIDCVKLLLEHLPDCAHSQRAPTPCSLLHCSCRYGSQKCLEYYVRKSPESINEPNTDGDVPLLEAVVWGPECSRILIENGADVNLVSKAGDTALHRLYRNDIDGIFAIFDTTRYLLTTGIEQLINSVNLKGETALHLLVTHISYIGGNYFYPEQRQVPRWQLQPDYQDQVIQTIKLLLQFNADPYIHDFSGLQPLNKLLHVAFKACSPNDPNPCVQHSINSKYVYRNDFRSLCHAIDVLLEHSADVNTQCRIGHTPLILLIQCLLRTDIVDLTQQSEEVVAALEALLKHGANSNFICDYQSTCATQLAILAKRYFSISQTGLHSDDCNLMKNRYSDLICAILEVMLKYGLNPNHKSMKRKPYLEGGQGNALIDFVRLTENVSQPEEFHAIYIWLRALLRWGADPDQEPYPSDPIICHSQSSIFLKKQGTQAISHYIHEVEEFDAILQITQAEELLLLFYNTMSHKVLYDCLNTARFMARFHPHGSTGKDFLSVLNTLTENPRSLKQIARVCIYKSIDRQIGRAVPQLPLPNALKQYLLNIE